MSEANFAKLAAMSPITRVKPGIAALSPNPRRCGHDGGARAERAFEKAMKAAGNACETIIVKGGGHGMGGWAKLNSDYARRR
jgi:hypothetical protein